MYPSVRQSKGGTKRYVALGSMLGVLFIFFFYTYQPQLKARSPLTLRLSSSSDSNAANEGDPHATRSLDMVSTYTSHSKRQMKGLWNRSPKKSESIPAPAVPAAVPGPVPAPARPPPKASTNDYRTTQYAATPFPQGYESKLVQAARRLGLEVPDVHARHRADGGGHGPCPPHDMDENGVRKPSNDLAKKAGGAFSPTLDAPTLDSLAGITVGLVVVSYDAPKSLEGAMASWEAGGLLDLVDDRIAFLNAPLPQEISMSLGYGFRVYTPHKAEVEPLLARHRTWLSQFDEHPASKLFPPTRDHDKDPSRPATWVAPSQIMSYLELSTDVVIFAEKDYALPEGETVEHVVRSLLAGVAMLQGNTAVVRLRRMDDENREAIPDCCGGVCGNSFNNWGGGCQWSAHLNWLSVFCDTQNIEERSQGKMKRCFSERAGGGAGDKKRTLKLPGGGPPVEPLGAFCTSFDHSGWSNNVAMFRRAWWVEALGHGAVLSEGDNGTFEVNMILLCDYLPKKRLASGASGNSAAGLCQMEKGPFVHKEFDGFVYK